MWFWWLVVMGITLWLLYSKDSGKKSKDKRPENKDKDA